ncbi:MAG: hypothetical protein EOM80_05185 [Erysipelotrichia bacterium]|nr:hypothetical protein [Erysipelotrichia bacterium]
MRKRNFYAVTSFLLLTLFAIFLNGAVVRRNVERGLKDPAPEGQPNYDAMFSDGKLRIAVFWGWDHPRDTIMGSFPAFETLNGKHLYYRGKPVLIEIGMVTQINQNPKSIFQKALEDPSIDMVIYSGHARYGGGMAFSAMDDIFRSGNGDLIEDRHVKPYRIFKAGSEDLDATQFSANTYKIIMLNCCDSQGHFRESWSRRFQECSAPIDLLTVEFPVFNLYDHRRILNLLRDILSFSNWKTVKKHYDSEIHKRKNRLIIEPVYIPFEADMALDRNY